MQFKILSLRILNWIAGVKKITPWTIFPKDGKGIILAAIILTLTLVYFSNRGTLRNMIGDTLYWDKQIALTKSLLPKVKSEQEVINLFTERSALSQRSISLAAKQNILQLVKNYAQRMNIRIVNIRTDAQQLRNKQGNAVFFHATSLGTFVVMVEAEAGYENIVRYLDTLYRVSPTGVSIEWLKIDKDKTNPDRLKVSMELRFYNLL